MRVIAGDLRGRSFAAVPGSATRPTTDRVREAWASTVISLAPKGSGFEGLYVLDAFAGSGALGIEALSRGAAHCVFVERHRRALTVIHANLASLGLDTSERSLVIAGDIFAASTQKRLPARLPTSAPHDLLILDPPYDLEQGSVKALLADIARSGALGPGTLISYEQGIDAEEGLKGSVLSSDGSPFELEMLSCKTYGTTQIRYYLCR
ncbi:MAG: RsmD family RNA methyltransferase [Coriobacteriales bacterium]|jgi:16S rRNA (guanine966-N2)-methyltransferase|nr:RsmD family RNA methyltransferase [Coriobacteriales bacterium]